VSEPDVLLPAEAARRLGGPTRVIVQAMYERKLARVQLEDGTLGTRLRHSTRFEFRAPRPAARRRHARRADSERALRAVGELVEV